MRARALEAAAVPAACTRGEGVDAARLARGGLARQHLHQPRLLGGLIIGVLIIGVLIIGVLIIGVLLGVRRLCWLGDCRGTGSRY